MDERVNVIISGRFCDEAIYPSESSKYLYISAEPERIYLTKNEIKSIEVLNQSTTETSAGNVLTGAVIAGVSGAIAVAADKNARYLIQIMWQDGSNSIARVTGSVYEGILVGMNESVQKAQMDTIIKKENEIEEREAKSQERWNIVKCAILVAFIAWIIWIGAQ